MDVGRVDLLRHQLVRDCVYFDLEVDDEDRWMIRIHDSEPILCERTTLVEIKFTTPLCEEFISVDLIHLIDASATLVVFDDSYQSGQSQIIGIRSGHLRSKEFIEESIAAWTVRENFVWPETVEIKAPELVSLQVIS